MIRPDVLRLKNFPFEEKFQNGKFWSPATFNRDSIPHGFKMKWHQVGNGSVQLRLPVVVMEEIYLCSAYVKKDEKMEKRMLAKFKTHIQLIQEGKFIKRGELS